MTSRAIGSYFLTRFSFSTLTQYMSASHGYSTIGGIEYNDGGYVEKTKKGESLTSTGYGDAHQLMSMRGVGIALQRMH